MDVRTGHSIHNHPQPSTKKIPDAHKMLELENAREKEKRGRERDRARGRNFKSIKISMQMNYVFIQVGQRNKISTKIKYSCPRIVKTEPRLME